MKKLLVLLLAMVYVSITSGVLLNIHYCMGEKSSVSYGVDDSDHCGKCGMKDKNSCCHSEYKLLKVQDEHLFAKTLQQLNSPEYVALPEQLDCSSIALPLQETEVSAYLSPPDPRANTLRIYNGVFRI